MPHQLFSPEERTRINDKLKIPLEKKDLKKRQGPGSTNLTYISAERAITLANDVFGFDGWNSTILELKQEHNENVADKYYIVYSCRMRVTLRDGTTREDVGTGVGMGKIGDAIDKAIKKAVSDAKKRCLKDFGDGLGLCLYNVEKLKQIERQSTRDMKPKAPVVPTVEVASNVQAVQEDTVMQLVEAKEIPSSIIKAEDKQVKVVPKSIVPLKVVVPPKIVKK